LKTVFGFSFLVFGKNLSARVSSQLSAKSF
jgi:hypothetical protein